MSSNVFVIGAAKSGTTWLYECLEEHPEANLSSKGEIDFFSYHYKNGEDWYLNHFEPKKGSKVNIDISPSYLTDIKTPERIYKFDANAIIVLVVREPIERAYSHYCMHFRAGLVDRDVDQKIKEGSRYVEDGLYYKYICEYLKYFKKNQLFILKYDDLKGDSEKYFQQFCQIAKIDKQFMPSILNKKIHTRKGIPKHLGIYRYFTQLYGRLLKKTNSRILIKTLRMLRSSRFTVLFHSLLNEHNEFPKLSLKKREELRLIYEKDLVELSNLLSLDYTDLGK